MTRPRRPSPPNFGGFTPSPVSKPPKFAGLALAASGLVILAGCDTDSPSALDPQGSEADTLADVWWLMFGLAAFVYVVVGGFVVYALLRGRRGERVSRIRDNTFVWMGGVVGPLVILLVLAVATVAATNDLREPEADPLRIDVTGLRWWWQVIYPEEGIVTANEFHLPTDRPIEIRLRSEDVLHSFWIPELAGKMDAVPDQTNVLTFTIDEPGFYRGFCAEFCGIQHANMGVAVIAEEPDEFQRWVAREQTLPTEPSNELEAEGRRLFVSEACAGCHTVRGTGAQGTLGPDLTDVGQRRTLAGLAIRNTPERMAEWITDAQQLKPGNLMPPIELTERETAAIVAYLQSLK